ncbi:hypothetical protein [Burkholderia vietnamiensis]|nr:hypothetical protein [Burkholderia vietnamiensis]MCA8292091.1 hypothetical protein [Burkholderia vietnamiensis]
MRRTRAARVVYAWRRMSRAIDRVIVNPDDMKAKRWALAWARYAGAI